MRTQSRDTSPEAERVLIELIRKAPITKRFGLVRSMTTTLTKMSIRNYRKLHPQAPWFEIVQILTPYPPQLNLQILEICLENRNTDAIFEPDILRTLISITGILESLKISYYVGGSLASAIYGMQQLTQDLDLVVDLQPAQTSQFLALLQADYYINEQEAYTTIQKHKNISIIHLDTFVRVDIIIPIPTLFENQMKNRVKWHILDEILYPLPFSSAEDIILIKLFHHGKEEIFPDDQWNDILGVLKVQEPVLDLSYFKKWAAHLTITNLLKQACIDSGLNL